jgi:hypothetical protein
MSKTLWKRDKMLLKEFPGEVEIFDIDVAKDVEQLVWEMKKILESLKGKVVEIGIDATCELSCI